MEDYSAIYRKKFLQGYAIAFQLCFRVRH